jgi:hypothetical protein
MHFYIFLENGKIDWSEKKINWSWDGGLEFFICSLSGHRVAARRGHFQGVKVLLYFLYLSKNS